MNETERKEKKKTRRRTWVRWGIGFAVILIGSAGFLAYLEHDRRLKDQQRQTVFVDKFRASFISGEQTLVGPVTIEEIHRTWMPEYGSIRPPGVNEYVVTAQFEENGNTKWGRWIYTCNEETNDLIYKHSFANAATQANLPKFPKPLQKALVEPSWQLIDGVPVTAGPSATLVSVSSKVRVNEPLQIRATAPLGTECIIECFPPDAVMDDLEWISPEPDKTLSWNLKINPKMVGGNFMVKIRCKQSRGNANFENSISVPNVQVLAADKAHTGDVGER